MLAADGWPTRRFRAILAGVVVGKAGKKTMLGGPAIRFLRSGSIALTALLALAAAASATAANRGAGRVDDQLHEFFAFGSDAARSSAWTAGFGGAAPAFATDTDEIFWDGMELCGNGVIDDASEECDRNDLGGATCLTYGFTSGSLSCDRTCHIDPSQCSGACPTLCNSDADCGVCGPCIPVPPMGFCAL